MIKELYLTKQEEELVLEIKEYFFTRKIKDEKYIKNYLKNLDNKKVCRVYSTRDSLVIIGENYRFKCSKSLELEIMELLNKQVKKKNVRIMNYGFNPKASLALAVAGLAITFAMTSEKIQINPETQIDKSITIDKTKGIDFAVSTPTEPIIIDNDVPVEIIDSSWAPGYDINVFSNTNFREGLDDLSEIEPNKFNVGTRLTEDNIQHIEEYLATPLGKHLVETAASYGVDARLVVALLQLEGSLRVENMGQHNIDGQAITANNYAKEEYVKLARTHDIVYDPYLNNELTAMLLQNKLDEYKGNIVLALYGYNFGYVVDLVLEHHAFINNCSVEEIISNHAYTEWVNDFEAIANPDTRDIYLDSLSVKVIDEHLGVYSTLKNTKGIYGHGSYAECVLSYLPSDMTFYYDYEKNKIIPLSVVVPLENGLER